LDGPRDQIGGRRYQARYIGANLDLIRARFSHRRAVSPLQLLLLPPRCWPLRLAHSPVPLAFRQSVAGSLLHQLAPLLFLPAMAASLFGTSALVARRLAFPIFKPPRSPLPRSVSSSRARYVNSALHALSFPRSSQRLLPCVHTNSLVGYGPRPYPCAPLPSSSVAAPRLRSDTLVTLPPHSIQSNSHIPIAHEHAPSRLQNGQVWLRVFAPPSVAVDGRPSSTVRAEASLSVRACILSKRHLLRIQIGIELRLLRISESDRSRPPKWLSASLLLTTEDCSLYSTVAEYSLGDLEGGSRRG